MIRSKVVFYLGSLLLTAFLFACQPNAATQAENNQSTNHAQSSVNSAPEITSEEIKKILASATEQTKTTRSYDPAYVVLPYPNGDVPMETGVCSDVVIRAFRRAGVDLQKEIHEDMVNNFAAYPKKWGLTAADSNIDHRRVPNLQTFFTRKGKSLEITEKGTDYKPGDVVAWHLDNRGTTHIGLVSNIWNKNTKRYSIIHNIGGGTNAEDVLFDWKIVGHYRYF
jgi:uncharacterized protein